MNNERRPPMNPRDSRGNRRPGTTGQRTPGGGFHRGGLRRPGGAKSGVGRGRAMPRRRKESELPENDEILSGPIEAEFLRELVSDRRQVEVRLRDGAVHAGTIEYWDQRFIRLTTESGPNLFIFKQDIKYLMEL